MLSEKQREKSIKVNRVLKTCGKIPKCSNTSIIITNERENMGGKKILLAQIWRKIQTYGAKK